MKQLGWVGIDHACKLLLNTWLFQVHFRTGQVHFEVRVIILFDILGNHELILKTGQHFEKCMLMLYKVKVNVSESIDNWNK